MDYQENTVEKSPLEQVGNGIRDLVEGKTQFINQVIDNVSSDEFYTALQSDIIPSTLSEYNPRIKLMPLNKPTFEQVRADMHVGDIEYYQEAKVAVIDTTKATVSVAAFNLRNGKRIALLAQLMSNKALEDLKTLRPDYHSHQTIGS